MNQIAGSLGALVLALALAACSSGKPAVVPSADGAEPVVVVRVVDNAYEPKDVQIAPGQAVKWVFENTSMEHDVVAEDGSFVSELTKQGSYTHVFAASGEYAYDCSIHPEMRGLVSVQ